jgi:predicted RNA-binding Zn ribbon-like protein
MHSSYQEFMAHGHGKTGPWFDLVNSEEWDTFGHRTDHFGNPAWLPFFLRRWQFAKPKGKSFPSAKFAALRETLRSICQTGAKHESLRPADLRKLNQALNVTGSRRLCQCQNGFQLEFVCKDFGWDGILAETARSFADVLASGDVSRIKICRNPECRWVFYDRTKARSRCWCDDKVCGNRERVRRARSRVAR